MSSLVFDQPVTQHYHCVYDTFVQRRRPPAIRRALDRLERIDGQARLQSMEIASDEGDQGRVGEPEGRRLLNRLHRRELRDAQCHPQRLRHLLGRGRRRSGDPRSRTLDLRSGESYPEGQVLGKALPRLGYCRRRWPVVSGVLPDRQGGRESQRCIVAMDLGNLA